MTEGCLLVCFRRESDAHSSDLYRTGRRSHPFSSLATTQLGRDDRLPCSSFPRRSTLSMSSTDHSAEGAPKGGPHARERPGHTPLRDRTNARVLQPLPASPDLLRTLGRALPSLPRPRGSLARLHATHFCDTNVLKQALNADGMDLEAEAHILRLSCSPVGQCQRILQLFQSECVHILDPTQRTAD